MAGTLSSIGYVRVGKSGAHKDAGSGRGARRRVRSARAQSTRLHASWPMMSSSVSNRFRKKASFHNLEGMHMHERRRLHASEK